MNILNKTKTYLVGHMQYLDGQDWRLQVEQELTPLGITCFNPYKNPFGLDEGPEMRENLKNLLEEGNLDAVGTLFSQIRNYDLSLCDRADFIIAHIHPAVASWGSAEELSLASRIKRPTFISVEGGRSKVPYWMTAQFKSHCFYNSIDEVLDMIKKINCGQVKIDSDYWRLLKEEYR